MNHAPKKPRKTEKKGARQRGAALMIFMSIILLGGLSMALDALLIKSKRMRSDQVSNLALTQAKKALIAYAEMQAVTIVPPNTTKLYGKLPCPYGGNFTNSDTPSDAYGGNAEEDTPCTKHVGFLPWKTLGLPPLFDGDQAPIWYAVSPRLTDGYTDKASFVCPTVTDPFISSTDNKYAAILISPGNPLPSQKRLSDIEAINLIENFLELENNNKDKIYETRNIKLEHPENDNPDDPKYPLFNDRLLGITCKDLMELRAMKL